MNVELKGIHVLAVLLGFFGVTLAVNGIFITYALSTFSGEDISTPYQRGLEYNKTLAARAAQASLKWTASIDVARGDGAGAVVTVSILGADGTPRTGLTVAAVMRRPTDAGFDQTVALKDVGGGLYRGEAANVAEGQWDVIATATGGALPFEAERRVHLK